MVTHLTVEQRQLALRLRARGLSLRQIGPQVGCSHELVRIIARGGPGRPQRRIDPWAPGPGRLTLADREEISLGLHVGEACAVIAARLGRAASTVSREVAGNGGRGGYRAWRAHQRARERARRPKVPKLACPRLAAQVTGWLEGLVVAAGDLGAGPKIFTELPICRSLREIRWSPGPAASVSTIHRGLITIHRGLITPGSA